LALDLESGGLNYNESLIDIENKQGARSPGLKGIRDPINEVEDEHLDATNEQYQQDTVSADRRSGKSLNKAMLRGAGPSHSPSNNHSGQTSNRLREHLDNHMADSGSEGYSDAASLMGKKRGPTLTQQLKQSTLQNNRKVTGATSIRSLIRSAATRDK
jgi:hypothetical protein